MREFKVGDKVRIKNDTTTQNYIRKTQRALNTRGMGIDRVNDIFEIKTIRTIPYGEKLVYLISENNPELALFSFRIEHVPTTFLEDELFEL